MNQRPIIVFDVNETLLDLDATRPTYHSVASELDVDPGDICLIACHVWDTIGLILREGNAPLDVGPQPNYIGDDLDAIADQLIERYPGSATAVGLASGSAAN